MLDHINRDPSDNRLCNLRVVDHAINNNNRRSSDHGNVWEADGKWRAELCHRNTRYSLGRYPTEEMARLISRGVKKYIMIFEEAML